MNGSQTMLTYAIANERSADLRAEAQRDRFFTELGRLNGVPTPLDRARRVLGQVIVRTGEMVGGECGSRGTADHTAAAAGLTILRPAR